MKQIAIYGAFDRFNYGDILFPIILERIFENYSSDFKMEYYGIINSDLNLYGGKRTKSFEDLFKKNNLEDGSIVIVAGGEVLATGWFNIFRFLLPDRLTSFIDLIKQNIPNDLLNTISPLIRGKKLDQPYVIEPEDFENRIRVVYNAVGGVGLRRLGLDSYELNVIKKKLSRATYISVRDQTTFDSISSYAYSISANLAPDCATLMSLYFPKDFLSTKLSPEIGQWIKKYKEAYIIFQIKKRFADDESTIRMLVNEIESIYNMYNLPAVLCPIGTAAYHEDQVPLKAIYERINSPSLFAENISEFEIMALIANSRLFIGSSLHGAITAMSFSIPNLVIPENLYKLQAYLDTWALPSLKKNVQINMISKEAGRVLKIPKYKLEQKRQELIEASKESINLMHKALNESEFDSDNKHKKTFIKFELYSKENTNTISSAQCAEIAYANYWERDYKLTRKWILGCFKSDFSYARNLGLHILLLKTYISPRIIRYLMRINGSLLQKGCALFESGASCFIFMLF